MDYGTLAIPLVDFVALLAEPFFPSIMVLSKSLSISSSVCGFAIADVTIPARTASGCPATAKVRPAPELPEPLFPERLELPLELVEVTPLTRAAVVVLFFVLVVMISEEAELVPGATPSKEPLPGLVPTEEKLLLLVLATCP